MMGVMTAAESARTDLAALLHDALPPQGAWSDKDYLWLTDRGGRRVEFTHGHLRELPLPTFTHQAILLFLYRVLHDWLAARGGVAMAAVLRVRLCGGKFREPDVLALRDRLVPAAATGSGQAPTWWRRS